MKVGAGSVERTVSVLPNIKYTIKAKARKVGGGWYRLGAKDAGSGETYTEKTNTNWEDITHTFKSANSSTVLIYFYNGSSGTAYGDDFELQQAGCMITSEENNEDQKSHTISLHPNPSTGTFKLETSQSGIMQVYNLTGALLSEKKVFNSIQDGEDFVAGVYIIRFTTDSGSKAIIWTKTN